MEEIVENNEKATKRLGGITGKGFMPGKSGNPGGRPRGGLKDYDRKKFLEMTDDQKEAFLKGIAPELRYRMAEGNPHNTQETDVKGKVIIQIDNDVAEKNAITSDPEISS